MSEELLVEEVNKIDQLGKRIEQYKEHIMPEIAHYVQQHNHFLSLIDHTGINDPEMDPVLLGPSTLAKVETWYGMARKEAYAISAKSRDLQKFYLAIAEQGKSNQYERVRRGHYDKDMKAATDAKEIARRIGGRLEEKAAYWEGEYLRWHGAAEAYEHIILGVKDLYKLAEFEYHLSKKQ